MKDYLLCKVKWRHMGYMNTSHVTLVNEQSGLLTKSFMHISQNVLIQTLQHIVQILIRQLILVNWVFTIRISLINMRVHLLNKKTFPLLVILILQQAQYGIISNTDWHFWHGATSCTQLRIQLTIQ